jgi:FKBP-type peptidyl-prolyl cis-trans isomerase SlyD
VSEGTAMKAAKDTVVAFHYSVDDGRGSAVEDSRPGGQPLYVLLGRGQLIPGMEQALFDREPGEHFEIIVEPEQGYGPRRDGLVQRVPKKYFRDAAHLKPGMTTVLNLREGGQRAVTVHKLGMSTIDVDLNHPMAGKTLKFDIDVIDVREATPEELAHGHAHAPGTHEHG